MSAVVERSQVFALEEAMKREFEQIDVPITHYFSQGVYGRRMDIKKGTVLTGLIHKYPQLNVMLSGDVTVVFEDGPKRVRPPFVRVCPAGAKRIFWAHEDSSWLVVHGTDENDVEKIEQHFIAQTEAEYLEHCNKLLEVKP